MGFVANNCSNEVIFRFYQEIFSEMRINESEEVSDYENSDFYDDEDEDFVLEDDEIDPFAPTEYNSSEDVPESPHLAQIGFWAMNNEDFDHDDIEIQEINLDADLNDLTLEELKEALANQKLAVERLDKTQDRIKAI